jgi:hypothetical protein
VYLLLYSELDKVKQDWLMRYALPVSPLAWVHNSHVEGTTALRLDGKTLEDLQEQIFDACAYSLGAIENKIKSNSLRGTSKGLTINKLNLIIDACADLKLIGYAKSLLEILGESDSTQERTESNQKEKANPLGVDKKATEAYLLKLAKKPTIH